MGCAPRGDRLTFDVLEHSPRTAVLSDAAVEQPRDAGMIQAREDAALDMEAFDLTHRLAP